MKWFIVDFLFGVWIVPLLLILIVVAALTARPVGGWRTIIDNSGKHEARIAEAYAREAEARAAEARGFALGEAHKAWAGNLPLILLVAGGMTVGGIYIYWQGRTHVELARQKHHVAQLPPLSPNVTVNVLPADALAMLEQYAQAHGKQLQTDGIDYYLVDNATGETQRVKPKGLLNG